MASKEIEIKPIQLAEISRPPPWLKCTNSPFTNIAFLRALENSGSVTAEAGWMPIHLGAFINGELMALMPLYLKMHSYGEYVFDHGWAQAYESHGLNYYPKLVCAIPFTPSRSRRVLVSPLLDVEFVYLNFIEYLKSLAFQQMRGQPMVPSSFHLLFDDAPKKAAEGLLERKSIQFHFINNNYTCFDDFLSALNSRARKMVRRERLKITQQSVTVSMIEGDHVSQSDWDAFINFYQRTYIKRSGHQGYLTPSFFHHIAGSMKDSIVMSCADNLTGRRVAAALFFKGNDTLYGRYWGADEEYDALHFECCYYQAIDYVIKHKMHKIDAGAQGEHKIKRGFSPQMMSSYHWLRDSEFHSAVEEFLLREDEHLEQEFVFYASKAPYKVDGL